VRNRRLSVRLAALGLVLLSVVLLSSCSLFRSGENDDDAWGDPNWQIGGESAATEPLTEVESPWTVSQRKAGPRPTSTPMLSGSSSAAGDGPRLVATSRDENFWPTTEESKYAQSEISRFEEQADHAPESGDESVPDSSMLRSLGPRRLPTQNDDPLAGLLEDGEPNQEEFTADVFGAEDHSDDSIQRVGSQPQSEPKDFVGPGMNPSVPVADEIPPVIAPIPPSRTPVPSRTVLGAALGPQKPPVANPTRKTPRGPAPIASKLSSQRPQAVPAVIWLNSDAAPIAEAFKSVSLLNEQPVPTPGDNSVLDRRSKWSFSKMPAMSETSSGTPLLDPSIRAPSPPGTILKNPYVFAE
jgi:hypothetical protein